MNVINIHTHAPWQFSYYLFSNMAPSESFGVASYDEFNVPRTAIRVITFVKYPHVYVFHTSSMYIICWND